MEHQGFNQKKQAAVHWLNSNKLSNLRRMKDWASTSLGPPESWPQSLCAAVNIMLGLQHPAFIVWGPQFTLLYNNDCARKFSLQHPAAMGQPLIEAWCDCSELIESLNLIHAGESVHAAKNLHPGFCYAPIWNKNNELAGIFCTCSEHTDADDLSRQRTEAALRKSEKRLRLATEAAQIYTWEIDKLTGVIQYSPNVVSVLGFKPPENYARSIALLHPDDRETLAGTGKNPAHGNKEFYGEYRMLNPDNGEIIWIHSRGVRIDAETTNRSQRFFGIAQNITLRKRDELNARFLNSINSDLARLLDADEIMRITGGKIRRHFGVSRLSFCEVNQTQDEITVIYDRHEADIRSSVGVYRISDFLNESNIKDLKAGQPAIINDTLADPFTAHARSPSQLFMPYLSDGHLRFLLGLHHRHPYKWRKDEIGLIHELTTRVWLRLERSRAKEALATELADMQRLQEISSRLISEDEIGALLEEILNAGIAISRADMGSMQLLNAETNELQLLAWHGVKSTFVEFFKQVRNHAASTCGMALQTGQRVIIPDTEMNEAMLADPHLIRILRHSHIRAIQSTPLISRSGRLLGMLSTHWLEPHQPTQRELRLLDLLARQAADLIERHQSEIKLKKADHRKDQFLAMLGHELRNPLAPIMTALHLMRLKNDNGVERERNIIERQANHLIRLVDDLLDVSRITSGKIKLKKQPVELSDIVGQAIEIVSPLLEQRQHKLILKVEATGLKINADVERMTQVVSNLLMNAGKYTEKNGQISITAKRRKAHIELTIRDTGIGIDVQLLPRLFDLYTQDHLALSHSHGGLGLGLAIARNLITLHGGVIEAHSDGIGKGSEFTILLPRIKKEPASKRALLSGKNISPDNSPSRHILLVDDNEDAADSMRISLEAAGHTVHVAYDGASALRLANEIKPDVAMLNIGLPLMDGYELARRLRAQQGLTQLSLIALSGYGQSSDQSLSQAAGFDAHLIKPADPDQIDAFLKRMDASAAPHR